MQILGERIGKNESKMDVQIPFGRNRQNKRTSSKWGNVLPYSPEDMENKKSEKIPEFPENLDRYAIPEGTDNIRTNGRQKTGI